jgi:hypothetical protein
MHKNHYTTKSARSNTATHATMAIIDPSNYIPKLDANGSNFWKWDADVLMYAALNDASSILECKPKPSMLLYTEWTTAPEPIKGSTIDIDDMEQMHNLTRHADFDTVARQKFCPTSNRSSPTITPPPNLHSPQL